MALRTVLLYIGALILTVVLTATVAAGVTSLFLGRSAGDRDGVAAGDAAAAPAALKEVSLQGFVTNLADPGSSRYVDVSVVLLVHDERTVRRVEQMQTHLRDALLGVLRSKTSLDLEGEAGKARLSRDVRESLNEVLGAELIERVLITQLVVQ